MSDLGVRPLAVGDELEVELLRPANEGQCVAHAQAATLFIRGGIPGEKVRIRIQRVKKGGKLAFGQVIEVLAPAASRVNPVCPVAATCGGCDFMHVDYPAQLLWKQHVLTDQLERIGGITEIQGVPVSEAIQVHPVTVTGAAPGLGWRIRAQLHTNSAAQAGFRAHNSHEVVPTSGCQVMHPQLQSAFSYTWPEDRTIPITMNEVNVDTNVPVIDAKVGVPAPAPWRLSRKVQHHVKGRRYTVAANGFWQSHQLAADTLTTQVIAALQPHQPATVLDLYGGVGLFAGAIADAMPAVTAIATVESDTQASDLARTNLADLPQVHPYCANVADFLTQSESSHIAGVVVDPPRRGLGAHIVAAIVDLEPEVVVYVSCDAGSLARDLAGFLVAGYHLQDVTGFDLFGYSHHLECIAVLHAAGK